MQDPMGAKAHPRCHIGCMDRNDAKAHFPLFGYLNRFIGVLYLAENSETVGFKVCDCYSHSYSRIVISFEKSNRGEQRFRFPDNGAKDEPSRWGPAR
jgi:hypothetical protein